MEEIIPIYYKDKCIWLTTNAANLIAQEGLTNTTVIQQVDEATIEKKFHEFVDSANDHLILVGDRVDNFDIFSEIFEEIDAAGGVLWNEHDELLMINRLGMWDLPKGKLDVGEDMAMCAVREVTEETGVDDICLSGILKSTFHIYTLKKTWILKRTEWYEMSAPKQALTPQAEEDITQAIWADKNSIPQYLKESYPAIRFILSDFL